MSHVTEPGATSRTVKKASGVHLPCLNKAKVIGVWCDRWETTYSCKSKVSAASHAKLHAQLTAQSGVTRLTRQIILRERGEWMKCRISKEGRVREGAKLTWSWLFLCQLNSLACSVPSEASELWRWPGHPACNGLHCRQRVWTLSLSHSLVYSHSHARSLTCYQQTPTPLNEAICLAITVHHLGYFLSLPPISKPAVN